MWCFLQISKSPRLYDWQSFQPYRGSKGTLHADWSYLPKKVAYQDGGGGGDRVRDARFDSVLRQLEAVTAFAPLHTPSALSVIRFAQEHFPGLPQVACFDTTFHAELAEVARVLPISKELQLEGIQRYGFHGLSCESIVHQLANDLPNRLVIAHLGNGASVTAVKGANRSTPACD
jgi:Acetokinase family